MVKRLVEAFGFNDDGIKSELKWNTRPALPKERLNVLLLVYNDTYDEINVTSGCYDSGEFHDNPPSGTETVFDYVLAWAEYPTVGVVLNRQGINQVYVSRPW